MKSKKYTLPEIYALGSQFVTEIDKTCIGRKDYERKFFRDMAMNMLDSFFQFISEENNNSK